MIAQISARGEKQCKEATLVMGGALSKTWEESRQRERICSAICLYYAHLHEMGPEVILSVYESIAHAQLGGYWYALA
jgi:hypothetical protein